MGYFTHNIDIFHSETMAMVISLVSDAMQFCHYYNLYSSKACDKSIGKIKIRLFFAGSQPNVRQIFRLK